MDASSEIKRGWPSLIVFLIVTFAAAAVGGVAASSARSTYDALELPFWPPPGWLFGPVWTVLYVMIGIAGWLLWRGARSGRSTALLLWGFIVVTIVAGWRVARPASALLIPYLAWVSFATALNAAVWWLN